MISEVFYYYLIFSLLFWWVGRLQNNSGRSAGMVSLFHCIFSRRVKLSLFLITLLDQGRCVHQTEHIFYWILHISVSQKFSLTSLSHRYLFLSLNSLGIYIYGQHLTKPLFFYLGLDLFSLFNLCTSQLQNQVTRKKPILCQFFRALFFRSGKFVELNQGERYV